MRRDGYNLFLTASHCSSKSWEDDNTVFYQAIPDYYDFSRVGVEYDDKQGSSCGFLSVNVCRCAQMLVLVMSSGGSPGRATPPHR